MVVCSFASCNPFVSKEEKTMELVNQELLQMDWNTIDNYPLFYTCDETATKEEQRVCFEDELVSHFSKTLREFEFTIEPGIDSTAYVVFVIDKLGKIRVLDIEKDIAILDQMPEFDGVITQSLKSLPEIDPALKKGIPVATKFRIPIVLHSN
ncbi:hypothetical protein CLV91_0281 [Maribacter vaceletii]|uniref:TonB-like protein n=2 Tax=Maribacter vaceletii TaxID=1206816 RepID=A0A495EBJ9_9FLAO|nr:hypothetical protein CLV91_0281 [Maribacter vaceletii]